MRIALWYRTSAALAFAASLAACLPAPADEAGEAADSDSAILADGPEAVVTELAAADIPEGARAAALEAVPGMQFAGAERKERDGMVFYDVEGTRADGSEVELEFLLFDTVIMAGDADVLDEEGRVIAERRLSQLPGPADPVLAAEQLSWLEGRLNSSSADYLWVGGHYPIWAIGDDSPTGIEEPLRPLLNRWEAHYFNGHEHDLEHIVENTSKVNYICTGAGKECCYEDTNLNTVPQGSVKFAMVGGIPSQPHQKTSGPPGQGWQPMPGGFEPLSGFTSYRVGPETMSVVFHAHNGTVLYVTPPIPKRTKRPQPDPGPPGPFCGGGCVSGETGAGCGGAPGKPGPGCEPQPLPGALHDQDTKP